MLADLLKNRLQLSGRGAIADASDCKVGRIAAIFTRKAELGRRSIDISLQQPEPSRAAGTDPQNPRPASGWKVAQAADSQLRDLMASRRRRHGALNLFLTCWGNVSEEFERQVNVFDRHPTDVVRAGCLSQPHYEAVEAVADSWIEFHRYESSHA